MSLDLKKLYFRMSFRLNKVTPDEFGLVESGTDTYLYIDKIDGSIWKKKTLYDFGWGNEYGFMRLPELSFDEAWNMLTSSDIQENQYGAASLIDEKYSENLLEKIESIFSTPNFQINERLRNAFKILDLEAGRNRSETQGKSYKEVIDNFNRWKNISEKVKAFS